MSQVVISAYVEHLIDKHQRSGTIKQELTKLYCKIEKELGEREPDYPDGLPGAPVDKSKIPLWGDLCYVHGTLGNPGITYLDCTACTKPTKRRRT